jgi:hypothetical protein
MEHCNICNITLLKKNFKRHESTQKHLDNLQNNEPENNVAENYEQENYIPEYILSTNINEPNLPEPLVPIQPKVYKPKKEKRNKKKKIYDQLKREILNEIDDLEKKL